MVCSHSYYLFSVSRPNKNGSPSHDLSTEIDVFNFASASTPTQKAICRVALRTFSHYGARVKLTEPIVNRFKVKLWRMGKLLDKHMGGNERAAIGGRVNNGNFFWIDRTYRKKLFKRKDDELKLEAAKRIKLDEENTELIEENRVLKDTSPCDP